MPNLDLTVTADDGTPLAGTLTVPTGPGPHPTVLLLHGSGPLDRDGNTRRLPLNLGPPLADALAAEGIATLRYDRRGAGATPRTWQATGFTDNRCDAAAALRALTAHPAVRSDALGVLGHSEGALHALSLAADHDVRAVVLLAGYAGLGEDACGGRLARSSVGSPHRFACSDVPWERSATGSSPGSPTPARTWPAWRDFRSTPGGCGRCSPTTPATTSSP